MARSKCSEEEQSRLRLRYDLVAIDFPEILAKKPTIRTAKNPQNGITLKLEKEVNDANVPGGVIGVKSRAIWRQCVGSREGLSVDGVTAKRAADIACVEKWMRNYLQRDEVNADDETRIIEFYGLERKLGYPGHPLQTERPDGDAGEGSAEGENALRLDVTADSVDDMKPAVGLKRRFSPSIHDWLEKTGPVLPEDSKAGVKKEEIVDLSLTQKASGGSTQHLNTNMVPESSSPSGTKRIKMISARRSGVSRGTTVKPKAQARKGVFELRSVFPSYIP